MKPLQKHSKNKEARDDDGKKNTLPNTPHSHAASSSLSFTLSPTASPSLRQITYQPLVSACTAFKHIVIQ